MLSRNHAKRNFNDSGLFWAPYPHWKTLRSFAISTIREEGMGKASMEPQAVKEIEQYLDAFVKPKPEPANQYKARTFSGYMQYSLAAGVLKTL